MLQRCCDQKHNSWRYYGARGVKVCERWRSFENFLADMGPRPSSGHSLDRKPGADYAPGFVRWATWPEQVETRAPADPYALSQAGKRGAAVKRARLRKLLEHKGQLLFAFA
jgi:hypothetical protein